MRILLALALAAPGDYRDWINTAKQPGYFNTADAPATFVLFKNKARDAKAVSAANATSYDDFDPVSAENGFLLLDKFAKDAGSALGAEAVALNAVDALGAPSTKTAGLPTFNSNRTSNSSFAFATAFGGTQRPNSLASGKFLTIPSMTCLPSSVPPNLLPHGVFPKTTT